jgi:hypothetical protein
MIIKLLPLSAIMQPAGSISIIRTKDLEVYIEMPVRVLSTSRELWPALSITLVPITKHHPSLQTNLASLESRLPKKTMLITSDVRPNFSPKLR